MVTAITICNNVTPVEQKSEFVRDIDKIPEKARMSYAVQHRQTNLKPAAIGRPSELVKKSRKTLLSIPEEGSPEKEPMF